MPAIEPETIQTPLDDVPWATDGMHAPTFFVENIRGTLITRGFIKLNMIDHRLDPIEGTIKAVHVVTIVTPIDQARAWAKYLSEIADQNGLPTEEQVLAAQQAQEPGAGG